MQGGFGRTGDHYWSHQHWGVIPDVVTMAKGIGNGIPLGAMTTREEISQTLGRRLHFNTFGGNPISMVQGLATLEIIDQEGLQQNAKEVGAFLKAGLVDLQDRQPLIGEVRGLGLLLGVELVEDRESKVPARSATAEVMEAARERGLLIGKGGLHGNTLRIKPPLCITKDDAQFLIDCLDEVLTLISHRGVAPARDEGDPHMASLQVQVNGLTLPNPLVIGSGPPGTNANVIGKALDEGWGAVICKTISLDASKVVNVYPRYARIRSRESAEIYGWENIELISDRPFETWLEEFQQIKDRHPEGVLICSIMEEYRRDAWIEIVTRCQDAGVDAFELNFSCPHGLPERRMGSAMGEDPAILQEVAEWVMSAATVPVWAKLTPNVTHIEEPARAAFRAGCHGVSAINTVRCVASVNLDTLRRNPPLKATRRPEATRARRCAPSPCGCVWKSRK